MNITATLNARHQSAFAQAAEVVGCVRLRQYRNLNDFPNLKRWFETIMARPAVVRALEVGQEHRRNIAEDKEAQKVLFGQRAS